MKIHTLIVVITAIVVVITFGFEGLDSWVVGWLHRASLYPLLVDGVLLSQNLGFLNRLLITAALG